MRLSLGQHQRQVQKQVQTQRMIQAMEILQLSTQALQEKIQEELQENPTLEVLEDSAYAADENQEDADFSDFSDIFPKNRLFHKFPEIKRLVRWAAG